MKKIIGIALIVMITLVAITGCPKDVSLTDPIVGTWEDEYLLGKTKLVFNNDDTTVEIITLIDADVVTRNGTWTSNDTTITRTWSGTSSDTLTYLLTNHNKEMSLTSSVTGVSGTFIKQ
ncbi:MAG TPA: hypothetical protein GXZ47_08805 [Treponema sp.]|nr:hypothetical protein [Treponema sp.]